MQALIAEVEDLVGASGIPGLSIRIARRDSLVFACDVGVTDVSSERPLGNAPLFRAGSLTKPLTAQAVLGAIGDGMLALETPITKHIDELAADAEFRAITVADLLGHTSGLVRGPHLQRSESDGETLARIRASNLCFKPGTAWKYSNWGYFLLGMVFARATGVALDHHLAERVFRPLGMQRTRLQDTPRSPGDAGIGTGHWDRRRYGHPDPSARVEACPHEELPAHAGGLITTTDDYLRWLMSLTGPALFDEAASSAEHLFAFRRPLTRTISSCFGFFGEIDGGESRFSTFGMRSGFSAFCFIYPDSALAGVAIANCGARTDELRTILDYCARRTTGGSVPSAPRHRMPTSILAANRLGHALHLESSPSGSIELIRSGVSHPLIPLNDRIFRIADDSDPRHVLRLDQSRLDDAIVTIGDQRYVEQLDRLREWPSTPDDWTDLVGTYFHPLFGDVDVLLREGLLVIEFGAMYESPLDPIGDGRFVQRAGPFRFEPLRFRRAGETGAVSGLEVGLMVFDRRSHPMRDGA